MGALDVIARDVAWPVIKEFGYTRKGRTFRKKSRLGDEAVIKLTPFPGLAEVQGCVNFSETDPRMRQVQ